MGVPLSDLSTPFFFHFSNTKEPNGCSSLRSPHYPPSYSTKNHPSRLPQAPNHPKEESRPSPTQGPTRFHSRNSRSSLEGNPNQSEDHRANEGESKFLFFTTIIKEISLFFSSDMYGIMTLFYLSDTKIVDVRLN